MYEVFSDQVARPALERPPRQAVGRHYADFGNASKLTGSRRWNYFAFSRSSSYGTFLASAQCAALHASGHHLPPPFHDLFFQIYRIPFKARTSVQPVVSRRKSKSPPPPRCRARKALVKTIRDAEPRSIQPQPPNPGRNLRRAKKSPLASREMRQWRPSALRRPT